MAFHANKKALARVMGGAGSSPGVTGSRCQLPAELDREHGKTEIPLSVITVAELERIYRARSAERKRRRREYFDGGSRQRGRTIPFAARARLSYS
jgi:hypothetical protein